MMTNRAPKRIAVAVGRVEEPSIMPMIRWKGVDGKRTNWLDNIPDSWASKEGRSDNLRHLTLQGGTKPVTCFCDVVVDERRMVIYYDGKHTAANSENFFPGQTIIRFDDGERELYQRYVDCLEDGTHYKEAAEIEPDEGESEGAERLRTHKLRERDGRLPRLKKEKTLAETSKLACEACQFDFLERYGELGFAFCEVHHNEKIAGGERVTSLDDLAIVCANCHRMIHRSEREGEMLTVKQLRDRIRPGKF